MRDMFLLFTIRFFPEVKVAHLSHLRLDKFLSALPQSLSNLNCRKMRTSMDVAQPCPDRKYNGNNPFLTHTREGSRVSRLSENKACG